MKRASVEILNHEEELALLGECVDLEHGLIRELIQPGVGFEDPDLFVAIALPSRIWNTGLFPGQHALSEGNAVGDTEAVALLGAIGESLERYALAFYDRSDLLFSTYQKERHSGRRLADPESFALFAPDQPLPWGAHFTRESLVAWTEGLSLLDRRSVWVPAQLVYLPYAPTPDEDYFCWSTSSGAAFGPSPERAALSGLFETIERDAFAIYWLNQLRLPAIDLSGYAPLSSWYAQLFGRFGNELCLYDITTDVNVPCFFALLKGRPGQTEPFVSVGAACHVDPERAIKKAIVEAFHTRRYGMNLMQVERGDADPHLVQSMGSNRFHSHVLRYTAPVPGDAIEFCHVPSQRVPVAEVLARHATPDFGVQNPLGYCVRRLGALGLETLIVDTTTPELEERGFATVKALVPGLHPLWAGEDVPLGGRRIYDVPPQLNHPRRTREQMNLFPHPFP